jgi:glutamyl-tRNA reductase
MLINKRLQNDKYCAILTCHRCEAYTLVSSRTEPRNTDLGFLVDGNSWKCNGFKQS